MLVHAKAAAIFKPEAQQRCVEDFKIVTECRHGPKDTGYE
jgi:hypothetical protein